MKQIHKEKLNIKNVSNINYKNFYKNINSKRLFIRYLKKSKLMENIF